MSKKNNSISRDSNSEAFQKTVDVTVQRNYHKLWVGFGCRFKANCPLVGLGPIGGVPSVGIFLTDPSSYLCEFQRKPPKTPNG